MEKWHSQLENDVNSCLSTNDLTTTSQRDVFQQIQAKYEKDIKPFKHFIYNCAIIQTRTIMWGGTPKKKKRSKEEMENTDIQPKCNSDEKASTVGRTTTIKSEEKEAPKSNPMRNMSIPRDHHPSYPMNGNELLSFRSLYKLDNYDHSLVDDHFSSNPNPALSHHYHMPSTRDSEWNTIHHDSKEKKKIS